MSNFWGQYNYIAKYLKPHGLDYIVVAIRWYVGNDKASRYNEKDQKCIRRIWSIYTSHQPFSLNCRRKRFQTIRGLFTQKGLKFGIHIMKEIPVIVVKQNLPIKGTKLPTRDIYSEKDQYLWLYDMYTVLQEKPGAQEYYNSLFELYTSWDLIL